MYCVSSPFVALVGATCPALRVLYFITSPFAALANRLAGLTVVVSVPNHEVPDAGQVALGPVLERLVLLEDLLVLVCWVKQGKARQCKVTRERGRRDASFRQELR